MSHVAKAITGAIVSTATAVVNATGVLTEGGSNVTTAEWLGILGAAVAGFGLVWLVPNSSGKVNP